MQYSRTAYEFHLFLIKLLKKKKYLISQKKKWYKFEWTQVQLLDFVLSHQYIFQLAWILLTQLYNEKKKWLICFCVCFFSKNPETQRLDAILLDQCLKWSGSSHSKCGTTHNHCVGSVYKCHSQSALLSKHWVCVFVSSSGRCCGQSGKLIRNLTCRDEDASAILSRCERRYH